MTAAVIRARPLLLTFLMGLMLSLSACVTLMAPFDETTNRLATDLQRKISTHFEALDGASAPECLHPAHVAFYDDARVDISALSVRTQAFQMNAETIQQTVDLKEAVDTLEQLHRLASNAGRCMSSEELSPLRRAFDSHLGAIIRLEIAKKRGAS